MERTIFHCDCNAFFASVEEQIHPEYKNVPMAVCGDAENRRGIILAKNELAKAFHVQTAETVWSALKKCPTLTLASPHHHLYQEYCKQINQIYLQYTDLVEQFGIDESFLDVTGSLQFFGKTPEELANEIKDRVRTQTGLTISVGVSFNRIFAKLGSDYKKPNAVTIISKGNFKEIVWPLPVSDLFFVGNVTAQKLERYYIKTIGDLAHANEAFLTSQFGKQGSLLYKNANGLDDTPVCPHGENSMQSVGNGMTFRRDLISLEDIQKGVESLSLEVARRLRKKNKKGCTIQITIKDSNFKVITRQKSMPHPSWLAYDIQVQALELIEHSWKIGIPIRMLTITLSKLIDSEDVSEQISLFEKTSDTLKRQKQENLEKTVDQLKNKYGKETIQLGSLLKNDLGIDFSE